MEDYAEILKRAEKEASRVEDPELRKIAFSKLVDHLLGGMSLEVGKANKKRPVSRVKKDQSRKKNPKGGPKIWIQELLTEGFFENPQASKSILVELGNRSHHLKPSDITWSLESLCHEKKLRRKKQAPAEGGTSVFHWSKW